jgi:alpha-glucosidase
MEEKATHLALKDILPGTRPFLISRSTFASSGTWTGHWVGSSLFKIEIEYLMRPLPKLGDNFSL